MLIQNLSPQLQTAIKKLPPDLASKAVEFNFYPGRYVHLKHLTNSQEGLSAALAHLLLHHCRSRKRITTALCAANSLNGNYNFEFELPLNLLALADFDDIRRIARIATLASHSSAASAFTDEGSIARIASIVGEDGFKYALAKADINHGLSLKLTSFLLTIETDTGSLLHEWWENLPPAIAARVALKFPAGFFTKTSASSSGLKALTMAASHFAPACITDVENSSLS